MKRQTTNLSEFNLAQIRRIERRLQDIEQLLLTNFKYDVNGASFKPPEPDPSAYDIAKTIEMLFKESTKFQIDYINADTSNLSGVGFTFGIHTYQITIERGNNV